MGWWAKTVLGAVLVLGGIGAGVYCVVELTQIGTCASGGPYVSARECPPGTEWYILGIFPSVISTLVGGWLLATRGRRRALEPGLPPQNPQP